MLVSLEVNYSGDCKFVWFFQVCNRPDEHSVIFPVPDGAGRRMGAAVTTAAYQMDFTHLWKNLSTYIVPRSSTNSRPRSVPPDARKSVYFLVLPSFPTSPPALSGMARLRSTNSDPNDRPTSRCRLNKDLANL